nr:RNA-directed DNA polymerase, eukaryota [Tanacetum cinerariifolium]
MDGLGNSETTSKTHLSQSEINSIKRQEKNEAFSKNKGDKTTNSIPSQKADHVGSSQNKKSFATSLNCDRDSKVEKQVTVVKGNTLSNVLLTTSLITPALVLDDSCVSVHDLSRHVMGKVKDLNSIPNVRTLLTKEGFSDVKLTYLGGMWVIIELDNEATKLKLVQHIGVNSWFHVLQAVIHDFVSDERIVWVDIEGDDESLHGEKNKSVVLQHREDDLVDDSDVEAASETFLVHENVTSNGESAFNYSHNAHNGGSILEVLDDMIRVGPARDSSTNLSRRQGLWMLSWKDTLLRGLISFSCLGSFLCLYLRCLMGILWSLSELEIEVVVLKAYNGEEKGVWRRMSKVAEVLRSIRATTAISCVLIPVPAEMMLGVHVQDDRRVLFLQAISKDVLGCMGPLHFKPLCLAIEDKRHRSLICYISLWARVVVKRKTPVHLMQYRNIRLMSLRYKEVNEGYRMERRLTTISTKNRLTQPTLLTEARIHGGSNNVVTTL